MMVSARLSLGLTLFCAAGCDTLDPYRRAGLWRPNHANETNLARMVAVPGDLAFGAGDGAGDGQQAVAALDRLRAGKVKPLPDSGLAQIRLQSSGAPAAAAGGTP